MTGRALIPVGRLSVATDATMAAVATTEQSLFRKVLDELISIFGADVIAANPSVVTAAANAVAAELAGADVITGLDERAEVVTDHPTVRRAWTAFGRISDVAIAHDGQLLEGTVRRLAPRIAEQVEQMTRARTTLISGWGDSLMEQDWLADMLLELGNGATAENHGDSGECSGSIAIRRGAVTLTLTADVALPSGTTSVAVTTSASVLPLAVGNSPTLDVTIGGRAGVLSAPTNGQWATGTCGWTFTPNAAGAAQTVVAGTVIGVPEAAAARDCVHIIWPGKNDAAFGGTTVPTSTTTATTAILDHLKVVDVRRFLIVGVTHSASMDPSTTVYKNEEAIIAAQAALAGRAFIDLNKYIVQNAASIAATLGIALTAADDASLANNCPPPSFMVGSGDLTHFSAAFRSQILAPFFAARITERGWK